MKNADLDRMKTQLEQLRENRDSLTIDADTHITDLQRLSAASKTALAQDDNYYHGRPISLELLLAELDLGNVDMALSWQNPAATTYGRDQEKNYEALRAANEYIADAARRMPRRIIPAGWTDPKALGVARARDLATYCISELGMPIVKMNPAQNQFLLNSKEALEVAETIVECGGMLAYHYGADTEYTPAEALGDVASRFPDTTVIGVHMGGGGAAFVAAEALYRESRALGLRHPNIHFVFSAKRDVHIESDLITYQLAGPPYNENLSCGSDAPYGKVTFNFAGYRALLYSLLAGERHPDPRLQAQPTLFDQSSVQGYLGGNFARLIIRAYERLLSR